MTFNDKLLRGLKVLDLGTRQGQYVGGQRA
jgi:hypothetical protein